MPPIQRLLSLPPGMSPHFESLTGRQFPEWMASSDPGDGVGSGGGTAWLLAEAWRKEGGGSFAEWLDKGRRLIIHSGGKSRRLPEFAPQGKVFMPVPSRNQALRWLLDDLVELGDEVFDRAPESIKVIVLAGDVLFRLKEIPALPDADLSLLGMSSTADEAGRHGVFVRNSRGDLVEMLQKPAADELPPNWLLDIGIWGLSTRGAITLMEQCGWTGESFPASVPEVCDLYSEFGPAASGLGLSTAVSPVRGDFIHLGTTQQFRDCWAAELPDSSLASLGSLPTEDHARFLREQRENAGTWVIDLSTVERSRLDLRQAAQLLDEDVEVEPNYAQLMMRGQRKEAFDALGATILDQNRIARTYPTQKVNHMVEAHAPLRLDLAGGWTDTPPYCLHFGGSVVNLAVEWDAVPPSTARVESIDSPHVEIISRDRGQVFTIKTWEDVERNLRTSDAPTIALAAIKLCGFNPENRPRGFKITMESRAPEGSGLGASSILAATLLGAMNEFLQLGWSSEELVWRTLCLEQIIGSHGGWQDQAGGIYPGLKLVQTRPGRSQMPTITALPDRLLRGNRAILLYNTGIQRRAFNVLGEIVEGMFLNEHHRLRILGKIGDHSNHMVDILRRGTYEQFGHALRRSWKLNQDLDSGTATEAIQALLDPIEDLMHGGKLLGAGGGGFFFIAAKDEHAAGRIKNIWTKENPGGQFVDWRIADRGLVVESAK